MPFALSQDADAERTLLTTVKTNSSKMPELPSLASGTRFLDDWRFHNILAICVAANAAAVGTTFATILFGSPAGFGASRLCRRASITLLTLSMLGMTLSFADSKSLLARSVFFVVIAAMTFAFLCDFDGPLLKRNLVFVVLSQQYQHAVHRQLASNPLFLPIRPDPNFRSASPPSASRAGIIPPLHSHPLLPRHKPNVTAGGGP